MSYDGHRVRVVRWGCLDFLGGGGGSLIWVVNKYDSRVGCWTGDSWADVLRWWQEEPVMAGWVPMASWSGGKGGKVEGKTGSSESWADVQKWWQDEVQEKVAIVGGEQGWEKRTVGWGEGKVWWVLGLTLMFKRVMARRTSGSELRFDVQITCTSHSGESCW